MIYHTCLKDLFVNYFKISINVVTMQVFHISFIVKKGGHKGKLSRAAM